MFVHLQKHKKDMGITELSVDDVFEFMKGTNQMQAMMSGIGLVPGLRYNQVKGLNRTQAFISNKTGAARDFLYGLADIGNETAAFGRIFAALADHPELQQQLAEHFSNVDDAFVQSLVNEGLDEQAARVVGVLVKNDDTKALLGVTTEELLTSYEEGIVRRAQEYVQTKLAKSSSAYRFGRTVGAAPGGQILKPLANFIDGLTSQIPRGSVRLIGDEMPLEIQRYLDLFRYAGVPSYVRDAWTQALIEAPTGGARIVGLTSLLDSVATATGMRMLDDGNKLLDKYLKRIKQIYSLDEGGRMTLDFDGGPTIPLGTLPDAEMASAWAIPDLHEIRKAVTQAKILNALIGIPESQVWQMLQNRIWKPMALLRLGFFTRNVGEELFATMMRYGTGSWIQERGARQLAQRDMYRDVTGVLREREMRGIIDAVDPADLWVRTARYDLPMIYRPVARAIDRLEGGQMWQQKLYDQLDFMSRMIERKADRVFARLEQGVASSPRLRQYAAETLGPYATVSTRRELFERQWKKMAFGSDHSFRRMLIGGVDKKMLMRAHAYERVYAKGMLEEIGTSRLAAWESTQTAPNVKRIIGGQDITDEEVMLVQTHSERILTTRDNAIPEAQPWWNAVLDRVAAPFDDKIGGSIYTPLVLWYNDDIQQAIPREELLDLLRPFAELYELDAERLGALTAEQLKAMADEGRRVVPNLIDRDLLQLFTEVHAGYFDKARFNAVLNRIEITPAKMAELQNLDAIRLANGGTMPHPLLTWAERRNRLINQIRDMYPGELEPQWWEIDSLFRQQLPEDGDFWIPQGYKEYKIWKDFVTHTDSQKRLVLELAALENASAILAQKPAYAREWIRNLLDHWQTNPNMIPSAPLLRSSGLPNRGPSVVVYRGISNNGSVSIDDQGNLIFEMRPHDHWSDRNATSFSLSRTQATIYTQKSVGHEKAIAAGANETPFLFSFRLDDFLASQNATLDDLAGVTSYEPGVLDAFLESQVGDYQIVRLQSPGSPWSEGNNTWSSAEIAIASRNLPDAGGVDRVIIPAGSWDAEYVGGSFFPDTDFKASVLANRSDIMGWPFMETEDQVRQALKNEFWTKIVNGDVENQLALNPRWMGKTENADTFFVIDTRNLRPTRNGASYGQMLLDKEKTPAVQGRFVELERGDPLPSAGIRQTPIVVKTLEDALFVQDFLIETLGAKAPIQLMDVLPGTRGSEELVPWTFKLRGFGEDRTELVLYGWRTSADGDLVGQTLYDEYPAVWNYLDEVGSETPIPVVNTFVDELFSRIRAGRRTRLEFIGDENAPDVWRNLGGTAHKLEAGDIVDPEDELYLTPTFEKDSRISSTDQRITRSFIAEYEGENEVMWSILAPTLLDRNQGATGRQLVERKQPIKVPGRRDEWVEVTDMERRLRAVTKRNVENTPAADLPDIEVAHSYKPYKANIVGSKVNKLFELMGKAIDTLSRKPMSFHAFLIAAERNEALAGWVVRESAQYKDLQRLLNVADGPNYNSGAQATYDRYVELGRIFAAIENKDPALALQYTDRQAFAYIAGMQPDEIERLGKLMGEEKWVSKIQDAWGDSTNVIERISALQDWLAGHEFAGGNIIEQLVETRLFQTVEDIINYVDIYLPDIFTTKGFPKVGAVGSERNKAIHRIEMAAEIAFGAENTVLSNLRAWDYIRAVKRQMDAVESTAQKYAAEHAIRDVMPFVDSHEIRSQYAEFMRGVLPFWYAEENFLKRWAKILGEGGPLATLQRLERLRLTYMGLQTAGIVRTDQQGNDYFVYPGSELLADVVSKAFGLADLVLPGDAFGARINPNLEVLFQSPTDMILPGFRAEFGQPSVSPLITTPMSFFKAALPFLQPLDAVLIGEEYQHRGMLERIIPSSVYRVFEAGTTLFGSDDINEVNERQAANMLAAMAHLQASGNGLPETNVTVEQRDEFIRRAAEHAKVIMVSQALAGYLLPGPPSALQLINGTSYEWITNGEITNPADLLASEYYELIQNMGIEEGTAAWLEMNPSGRLKDILNPTAYSISKSYSASGAPLPSTEDGINFYETNKDVFDAFPNAAAWLLPQDESDARTQTAYTAEQVLGLREKRAPVDFVNAMIYREGAYEYFQSQDFYEAEYVRLKNEGKESAARALKDRWTEWTAAYKATHPIFASELESGEARQRRKTTIQQMRIALLDPEFPKANHFDDLKMLQDSFDAYIVARGRLALDRTSAGQGRMQVLKTTFNAWATAFVAEHPAVGSYWLTVLKPESGVD